jgi:hypothetical protein
MRLFTFLIVGILSACTTTGRTLIPFPKSGSESISVPQLTTPGSDIAATLWPLSFAGALAILAGIVSMVLMPGAMGKRTLLIGVGISLVPPMFLALNETLLVPAAIVALIIGAGMFISTLRTVKKVSPCIPSSQ